MSQRALVLMVMMMMMMGPSDDSWVLAPGIEVTTVVGNGTRKVRKQHVPVKS